MTTQKHSPMESKQPRSFRLTNDAADLLTAIATRLGLTLTGTVELAVRELAKREGLR
jgi:hypothetical protein